MNSSSCLRNAVKSYPEIPLRHPNFLASWNIRSRLSAGSSASLSGSKLRMSILKLRCNCARRWQWELPCGSTKGGSVLHSVLCNPHTGQCPAGVRLDWLFGGSAGCPLGRYPGVVNGRGCIGGRPN